MRRVPGLFVLLVSLVLILWGTWPAQEDMRSLLIKPAELRLTARAPENHAPASTPAVLDARRLIVHWPAVTQVGDGKTIRLDLEEEMEGDLTPATSIEGQEARAAAPVVSDLYDSHNVMAEARLELNGMPVVPSDLVAEPLRPGQGATFFWSVRPPEKGRYQGKLWLHLRFVPLDGSPESRQLLSAQRIEIHAASLLGLNGPQARLLGGAGVLLGLFLALEGLVPWLGKRLANRDN